MVAYGAGCGRQSDRGTTEHGRDRGRRAIPLSHKSPTTLFAGDTVNCLGVISNVNVRLPTPPVASHQNVLSGSVKVNSAVYLIASGDTVGLKAIYTADAGGAKQEIAAMQDGTQTVATIDLAQIAVGTYKLTAALDNSVSK